MDHHFVRIHSLVWNLTKKYVHLHGNNILKGPLVLMDHPLIGVFEQGFRDIRSHWNGEVQRFQSF